MKRTRDVLCKLLRALKNGRRRRVRKNNRTVRSFLLLRYVCVFLTRVWRFLLLLLLLLFSFAQPRKIYENIFDFPIRILAKENFGRWLLLIFRSPFVVHIHIRPVLFYLSSTEAIDFDFTQYHDPPFPGKKETSLYNQLQFTHLLELSQQTNHYLVGRLPVKKKNVQRRRWTNSLTLSLTSFELLMK